VKFTGSIFSVPRYFVSIATILVVASSAAAQNQSAAPAIRVAVTSIPPFVMQKNGSLTGFSVDLWNAISARMKLTTDYQMVPDPASIIEMMRSKKADVVAAPVVITSARDEDFDFSLP
jgi:polar amino acid transport system substrate-binding protein